MTDSAPSPNNASESTPDLQPNPGPLPAGLLRDYPFLTFVLPFAVYMAITTIEPSPSGPGGAFGISISYDQYPIVYTLKIVATLATMVYVLPGYRTFPCRLSWLSPLVGLAGVVVWIGLCSLDLESKVLPWIGLGSFVEQGERPAFNPLEEMADSPFWAYAFLGVRFLGLAMVVPIFEEFLLRGFLMRYVVSRDWWELPFGTITAAAVFYGTLFPVLMHPAEVVATIVWFSMVHWLMFRTRSIWDCVVAHAVTNFLLGVYVVTFDQWHLM